MEPRGGDVHGGQDGEEQPDATPENCCCQSRREAGHIGAQA